MELEEADELRGESEEGSTDPLTGPRFSSYDSFGFSMGGLVQRAYQRHVHGTSRQIDAMVTMGTPHHGGLQMADRAITAVTSPLGAGALRALIELWSPGTADLLDYDELSCRFLDPELSGNATMCRMNLDRLTGPSRRLSLVAGTDATSLFDLFDDFADVLDEDRFRRVVEKIEEFILDPQFLGWDLNPIDELASAGFVRTGCLDSDGVVCVWSAHARTGPFPWSTTVPALAEAVAKAPSLRDFTHSDAGSTSQSIAGYADEDMIAILSDHFVAQPLEKHYVAPSQAPGEVRFRTQVEYNARQGDITALVAVVYGRYEVAPGEYAWKILAGVDENGEPEPDAVIRIDAPEGTNSVGGEDVELEALKQLSSIDPLDPSTDIDLVKWAVVPLGPSRSAVPPEPPQGGFNLPDPQP